MNDEVDTTGVHWAWLGSVRATFLLTGAMLLFVLLPLMLVALLGGGEQGADLFDKYWNRMDRFAVWSWKKITGDKT